MNPFQHNLTINQGATFREVYTWKSGTPSQPVDLTGATARAQIRKKLTDASPLLALTTENGRILLGGTAGTVTVTIAAADTEDITWTSGIYDLEIEFADGTVTRLMAGRVRVSKEITR